MTGCLTFHHTVGGSLLFFGDLGIKGQELNQKHYLSSSATTKAASRAAQITLTPPRRRSSGHESQIQLQLTADTKIIALLFQVRVTACLPIIGGLASLEVLWLSPPSFGIASSRASFTTLNFKKLEMISNDYLHTYSEQRTVDFESQEQSQE